MERKPFAYRPYLLAFMMLVLILPGLNHVLPFIESGKLNGAVQLAKDTSFSPEAWFSGGYQKQKESYLNDNIGFRPDLIRFNNQLDYELFGMFHANGVVEGPDHYLYERGYIDAYYGNDYLGDSTVKELCRKLRFIQDTLERAGKKLIITFVPSKARYYPEYFPKRLIQEPTTRNNYQQLKMATASEGLHVIDLNGWFVNQKVTTPHPLFSKMGIHWTRYGANHAMDTFNRYLGSLLNIHIPDLVFEGVDCSTEPRGDNDIATGLNLIWPYTVENICYDRLHFNEDSLTRKKPAPIFIGDSFVWTLLANQIPQHCYHNWEFWSYFSEIWSQDVIDGHAELKYTSNSDWMSHLQTHNAVVLFFTESNLQHYKDYFINAAYTNFGGK